MSGLVPALRHELDVPLASLAVLGTLLLNLTVFERTRAYGPAVAVLLGTTMTFFLGVVHYAGIGTSTVLWAYVFQVLPYFLAGRLYGALVVVAFDVILLSLIVAGGVTPASTQSFLPEFTTSMVILACVSFLFEHVRKVGHDRLLVEVAERRKAESEARRASEVAARAAAAQARFLANMSHEIRTPMNGVLGVNELLLLSELTEEQRDYARTIDASARSLLTVLNDILDLSKIESGHVNLERASFDVREVLTSSVALFQPEAQKRGSVSAYRSARTSRASWTGTFCGCGRFCPTSFATP